MAIGSNNKFPKVILTEQGSTPTNPDSGDQKLFIKTSDHLLYMVNASGTVSAVGGSGSGDVVGATGSVDGNLVVFDGVTGKKIKDGGAVPSAGAASLPLDIISNYGSGDGFAGTSLDGGWTSLQSTGVTSVDRSVDGYCILKNSGNTAGQDRGIQRAFAPAGDFTVWCKIKYATVYQPFQWAGLFVGASDPSDGVSGHRLSLHIYSNNNANLKLYKMDSTSETAIFSTVFGNSALPYAPQPTLLMPYWLRIRRAGTTLYGGFSFDGVQFWEHATTTTIAFTVATCGLYIGEATSTQAIQSTFDYIATTG